jgi:5-(carboxyamino)imidazole ribonucleotide mutase
VTTTVAILMGSENDLPQMKPAADVLRELGVACELHVTSAHRTPERTAEFVRAAAARGIRVFICGAGGAAHLAGAVAAHTALPVIGVPLANGSLLGLDALLATVQMPAGVPVATVAIGGAANAALLAAQMLALADEGLAGRLAARRLAMARQVEEADRKLASS